MWTLENKTKSGTYTENQLVKGWGVDKVGEGNQRGQIIKEVSCGDVMYNIATVINNKLHI